MLMASLSAVAITQNTGAIGIRGVSALADNPPTIRHTYESLRRYRDRIAKTQRLLGY
jgi:hypothetical protein